jgi:hypothetical protein
MNMNFGYRISDFEFPVRPPRERVLGWVGEKSEIRNLKSGMGG